MKNNPDIGATTTTAYSRFSDKSDLSVLVISAQAPVRLTIGRYLQGRGNQMHLAKTGREATDIDAAYMVDLIIVDAPLPDMPLTEMLTTIRERRRLMRDIVDSNIVPSIVVSQQRLNSTSGLSQLGVVAALRKPVNLQALAMLVQKVLTGELTVESDKLVQLGVLDPESRALEFFSKLFKADDVSVRLLKDRFDLANHQEERDLGILLVEIMGLGDDPVQDLRTFITRSPKTKVIVCTALHDADMLTELTMMGVKEVLTKPINPFNIRTLVREYVAKCQNEHE